MLAVGLLFPPLLLAVLALIVVLNMITAGQRFVKVWRQAAAPPKALSDRRSSRPGAPAGPRAPVGPSSALTPRDAATAPLVGRGPDRPAPDAADRASRGTVRRWTPAGVAARARPPEPMAAFAARGLAQAAVPLSADQRLIAERNMRRVLGPDASDTQVRRAVRHVFESYARYWVDTLRLPDLDADQVSDGFTIEGLEHIADALDRGVGPIPALPHVGGWGGRAGGSAASTAGR